MVAPEELAALCSDPYRVACPRGHTAIVPAETTDSGYCRTCRASYPAEELVDRRRDPNRCGPRRGKD
jgi:hypothetical protein